jgi:hypothetical protein
MKIAKKIIFIVAATVIIGLGCKKPYVPPVVASNTNYLVVEGVINSGQDSTIIHLSRTVALTASAGTAPELNALVMVQSDSNTSYTLAEIGNGNYAIPGLNLSASNKYRLQITTADKKVYQSDFVPVKATPPIDSVGFITQNNGIQLYVNAHDPSNNTRYYRWSYQETWQFHAKYETSFITDGMKLKLRTPGQQIFTCFSNQTSSTILLGSSAKLAQDVIYQSPVTQVTATSEKIEAKYSILVKQYALTSDAYKFWQNLKKNTEDLGTIFSSQPSEIPGNVHCITDPSEPVIGYISATNVQQKRIFISNSQLPGSWLPNYPYQCELDSLLYCRPNSIPCQNDVAAFLLPLNTSEFAIYSIDIRSQTVGYMSTDAQCADCTIRGTTKQPDFWR